MTHYRICRYAALIIMLWACLGILVGLVLIVLTISGSGHGLAALAVLSSNMGLLLLSGIARAIFDLADHSHATHQEARRAAQLAALHATPMAPEDEDLRRWKAASIAHTSFS